MACLNGQIYDRTNLQIEDTLSDALPLVRSVPNGDTTDYW